MNEILNLVMSLKINLLMQGYWLSIFLIGITFFYLLQSLKWKHLKPEKLHKLPLIGKAALSIALGYVIFLPCVVLGYTFHMPPWWMAAWYISLLMIAIVVAIKFREQIVADVKKVWHGLRRIKLFSFVTIFLLLIAMFVIADFLIGGYLQGDAIYHIGKVRHLATDGMNLTDFFYGTVTDTSHSVTIIHALYAIPTVFGVDAINAYATGLVFFNIMHWLIIGWLIYIFFNQIKLRNSGHKNILILALTTLAVIVSNSYAATYPATVATGFIVLMAVGIYYLFGQRCRYTPFLVAIIALAFTHILYAMIAAALLGLIYVCLIIFQNKRLAFLRGSLPKVTIGLVLLLTMSVVTIILQKIVGAINGQMLECCGTNYQYWYIGPLYAMQPSFTSIFGFGDGSAYILFMVLSIIGVATLFVLIKNKLLRIILACIILFIPLTVWNPVIFSFLHHFIPEWAIRRFQSGNVLPPISIGFGIIGVVLIINKMLSHWNKRVSYLIVLPLIVCVSIAYLVIAKPLQSAYNANIVTLQKDTRNHFFVLQNLMPKGEDVVVLTDDGTRAFPLVAATNTNIKIIAAIPTGSPGDGTQRAKCLEYLNQNWDLGVMKQLNVNYIFADHESDIIAQAKQDEKHAKQVGQIYDGGVLLYRLNLQDIQPVQKEVCTFNERKL